MASRISHGDTASHAPFPFARRLRLGRLRTQVKGMGNTETKTGFWRILTKGGTVTMLPVAMARPVPNTIGDADQGMKIHSYQRNGVNWGTGKIAMSCYVSVVVVPMDV